MLFKKQLFLTQILKHPIFICCLVILISFLISSFINGFNSETIYTLLKFFLITIFCLITSQIMVNNGFKEFLFLFVVFSLLLSITYLYQYISIYNEIDLIENRSIRDKSFDSIAATMGNKNLFSSIQFLLLPFIIYFFKSTRKYYKYLSYLTLVLFLLILVNAQTRAVIIAFFISFFTFLFLKRKQITYKHILLFLCSLVSISTIAYFSLLKTERLNRFKSRFSQITTDGSFQERIKLYNSTISLVKDNFLFGVGPGNWKTAIWKYDLYQGSLGNSFAQRPHNDFLWFFSEGGVFAGISYLLIFLILLRDSYILQKERKDKYWFLYFLIFCMLFGYGFISLVDFPVERISHNIIFFFIAAIIISAKVKRDGIVNVNLSKVFIYPIVFILVYILYVASIRHQGAIHASNAVDYKVKGNWNYVIKAIDKSYDRQYFEFDNTSTPLLWYRGVAYFNQQKYNLAFKDFKYSYKLHPNHVHVINNLATLYHIKGDIDKAKDLYRSVFELNPTFAESRINLAAILFNEKKYIQALDVILESKVPKYLKRKSENSNYDLYLKTIFEAWTKNAFEAANPIQKSILEKKKKHFDDNPDLASRQLKRIYEIRKSKNLSYLDALVDFYSKHY